MDDFKGVFTLVIIVVVIASKVLGPMLERRRKAQQERQSRPSHPEPEAETETETDEPMLPYEKLVEEVFGPHIQRRRDAYARRAEERAEKPQTTVRRAVPPPPPRPASPARTATVEGTKAAATSAAQAAALRPRRPALSLEERLFSNRRLSGAAKLVVAAEIFQPPRFLRRVRR